MTTYTYTYITSTSDLFKILIFRFVSVIVNNKEVIFIFFFVFTFTFFWFLFLEYVYNFFLNQNVLSEGSSILNAVGESSSQGSSQQNISGGGSSSNNPNPNPDPGPGPHYGTHPSYLDTVMMTDTDRLALYLEQYRIRFFQHAGVLFSDYRPNNPPIGPYDQEYSRIARFVRTLHPEWFQRNTLNTQQINTTIIERIRGLHMDVPSNYI